MSKRSIFIAALVMAFGGSVRAQAPVVPLAAQPLPTPTLAPPQWVSPASFPGAPSNENFATSTSAPGDLTSPSSPLVAVDPARNSLWIRADYLHWWPQGMAVPALVTSSPAGTPRAAVGVLGLPTTSILYGAGRLDDEVRHGGRITLGGWSDCDARCGWQLGFFMLEEGGSTFSAASDGDPSLARPFIDANSAVSAQSAQLVSLPGAFTGAVTVTTQSSLLGADALLRCSLIDPCAAICGGRLTRLDLLAGYRYLRLREGLTVREDITATDPTDPVVIAGTRFEVLDDFRTRNDFHAFDLGLVAQRHCGNIVFESSARLAFGVNHQAVDIAGANRTTVPGGGSSLSSGGLLTQSTNIGHYTKNQFAIVPELGVRCLCRATDRMHLGVGYSFLYWDHVVRPGEQIDPTVNSTQIGGSLPSGLALPRYQARDTSLWVHGLTLSVAFEF